MVLLDAFEGVQLFILFVLDEVDGTELTETEFLDHNHIFELQEIIIILLGIGGLHILNFMGILILLNDLLQLTPNAFIEAIIRNYGQSTLLLHDDIVLDSTSLYTI